MRCGMERTWCQIFSSSILREPIWCLSSAPPCRRTSFSSIHNLSCFTRFPLHSSREDSSGSADIWYGFRAIGRHQFWYVLWIAVHVVVPIFSLSAGFWIWRSPFAEQLHAKSGLFWKRFACLSVKARNAWFFGERPWFGRSTCRLSHISIQRMIDIVEWPPQCGFANSLDPEEFALVFEDGRWFLSWKVWSKWRKREKSEFQIFFWQAAGLRRNVDCISHMLSLLYWISQKSSVKSLSSFWSYERKCTCLFWYTL